MAGWYLSRVDFRGLGPHRPDELEDQCCRHHARRYIEPMVETAHRETVGKRVAPYWQGANAIRRALQV
jgi:hypothetical protein